MKLVPRVTLDSGASFSCCTCLWNKEDNSLVLVQFPQLITWIKSRTSLLFEANNRAFFEMKQKKKREIGLKNIKFRNKRELK